MTVVSVSPKFQVVIPKDVRGAHQKSPRVPERRGARLGARARSTVKVVDFSGCIGL